jgi:hypothetical protein
VELKNRDEYFECYSVDFIGVYTRHLVGIGVFWTVDGQAGANTDECWSRQ